jgi:hypothetical protein
MGPREGFSKEVHGRSVTAIKSFWNQQIFAGRQVPPQAAPFIYSSA